MVMITVSQSQSGIYLYPENDVIGLLHHSVLLQQALTHRQSSRAVLWSVLSSIKTKENEVKLYGIMCQK